MKFIATLLLKNIWGFKFEGDFPHEQKKLVIIVAPHTSWLDFPLGLLVKWSLNFSAHFIGKASLFKPPFGFIFKWLGGIPVNRDKNNNLVETVVNLYNEREKLILGIAPEGTRKKVDKWKTGFYFIAKGANVPILMIALDVEKRIIRISKPYITTDDMEKDFVHFQKYFEDIKGFQSKLP